MHPGVLVVLLAIVSMAMVFAMVQFSRTHLTRQPVGFWRNAYLLSWVAIIAILVMFLGDENLAWAIAFPLGWFALHALILRFAAAVRDAPQPAPRPRIEEEEEEEEEDEELPSPPSLTKILLRKLESMARLGLSALIALVIIAVGQQIELLHRIDRELAPYRARLVPILGILIAIGFAMFMGGIITFVLRGGQSGQTTLRELVDSWRDGTWTGNLFFFIAAGVLLLLVSAVAMGIVVLQPGLKLLVILAVAWVAVTPVILKRA